MPGLDPGLHHSSARWIGGSSPAMTDASNARFSPLQPYRHSIRRAPPRRRRQIPLGPAAGKIAFTLTISSFHTTRAAQATSQASPPNPIGTCCRQNRIHSNPPARIFDGSGSCELVERGLRCVIGRIGNTRVADGGDRGDIDDRAATLGTGARFNRGADAALAPTN
jgi:hypothetical protein